MILLCAALASLMGWKYWTAADASPAVVETQRSRRDDIRKTSEDSWRMTAGPAGINVHKTKVGAYEVHFYFDRYEFLTPRQIEVLSLLRRLANDRRLREAIEMTPIQTFFMREIRSRAEVEMPPANVNRVRQLFPAYERAEEPALSAQKLLRQAEHASEHDLGAASSARVDATRKAFDRLDAERRKAAEPLLREVESTADHLFATIFDSTVRRSGEAERLLTPAQWRKLKQLTHGQ